MGPFSKDSLKMIISGILSFLMLSRILRKLLSLNRAFKALGDIPGRKLIWLHPFRSSAPVLAPFFPFAGQIGDYYGKYDVYTKYGSTVLGSVKFPKSVPTFWVSDGEAIKLVSTNRNIFRRDLEGYEVVSVYGPNMVAAEGPEWKRYRSVAKPAFNEANNILVWQHATRIFHEWFTSLEGLGIHQQPLRIDLLKEFTEIALLILSSAAFGRHNSWRDHFVEEEVESSTAHRIPFRPAVTSAVENLVPKVLMPSWMFAFARWIHIPYISPLLNETAESFVALRAHMLELISTARVSVAGGSSPISLMDAALLTNLVQANMAQNEKDVGILQKRHLTDEELLSNTFMFLLAGHETSAHSLCFAICLLALYQDTQNKVYQEVLEVWRDGVPSADIETASSYQETMNKLEYTTAVFREALRLFPPVSRIASPVAVDCTLPARRFNRSSNGKVSEVTEFTASIPAQSLIVVDIIGLHYNPLHWGEDAEIFRPERFIDTESYRWPRQAFLAFSAGPRSCMGERFAMVESICILALLVRRCKITVSDELRNKSREEQLAHLCDWVPRMTLIPSNAFVTMSARG